MSIGLRRLQEQRPVNVQLLLGQLLLSQLPTAQMQAAMEATNGHDKKEKKELVCVFFFFLFGREGGGGGGWCSQKGLSLGIMQGLGWGIAKN